MSGLLVNGRHVAVPGRTVIAPGAGAPSWCALDPGDYQMRPTRWVRQVIVHTTKGLKTQHVIPGAGPGGRARAVADFWRGDPKHSAAQLVVDTDGAVICLCDLATVEAWHATRSNPWSIGIEMYQEGDGGVWDATLEATCDLVVALCDLDDFCIPLEVPSRSYNGHPMRTMDEAGPSPGGPLNCGVFGHRDNTEDRGWGDPGDEIFSRLRARGAGALDYDAGESKRVWWARQELLNHMGASLAVDGVPGPATFKEMRLRGFRQGSQIA